MSVPSPKLANALLAMTLAVCGSVPGGRVLADDQPQPNPEDAIDHFLCYAIEEEKEPGREVVLKDQFKIPPRKIKVGARALLCNPVDKTYDKKEHPRRHPRTHLVCYYLPPEDPGRVVQVSNQLLPGFHPFRVDQERLLCLPSGKAKADGPKPPIPEDIDHYKCYRGRRPGGGVLNLPPVHLKDQFLERDFKVMDEVMLCNPVEKQLVVDDPTARQAAEPPGDEWSEPRLLHGSAHLACYRLDTPDHAREKRQVNNQFESVELNTKFPQLLCVPSRKREG